MGQKWQYWVVDLSGRADHMTAFLQQAGDAEWELVAVVASVFGGGGHGLGNIDTIDSSLTAFLKRPMP
jgi:hypothetical protein